jgi:hypothetical protein
LRGGGGRLTTRARPFGESTNSPTVRAQPLSTASRAVTIICFKHLGGVLSKDTLLPAIRCTGRACCSTTHSPPERSVVSGSPRLTSLARPSSFLEEEGGGTYGEEVRQGVFGGVYTSSSTRTYTLHAHTPPHPHPHPSPHTLHTYT